MSVSVRRTVPAALCAAALLALAGCSSAPAHADRPAATARAEREAEAPDSLTAQTVAAALAKKTGVVSLGSPTDDTDDCSGGDGTGCRRLVTTDSVNIYEFDAPAVAAHWVKIMKKSGDWRRVGRFALAWTARDQPLIGESRRDALVGALQGIVDTGQP